MKIPEKITAILSIIVFEIPIFELLYKISHYYAYLSICLFCLLILLIAYVIQFKSKNNKIIINKKAYKMLSSFFILGIIFISILQIIDIHNKNLLNENIAKFEAKMQTCKWIGYEPIKYDRNKQYPKISELREELDTLLKNGFNGIITFSNDSCLNDIPKIVKNIDKNAGVIMGIIDLDKKTIEKAIEVSEYVDAYCIVQMFTDRGLNQIDILKAIIKIKTKTNKPVSTTLRPDGYKRFLKISKEIDWFFPDIHANWYFQDSVEIIFEQTKSLIEDVKKLQDIYPDKSFLLKMISFPSSENEIGSIEKQYQFFKKVIEFSESCMSFPERVYPSYFSAYDINWKTIERGHPKGENKLGFFDSTKTAKKIVKNSQIIKVIDALKWSRK